MRGARIHVVGVPPGAESLDPEVEAIVRSCDRLVTAERHRELVPDFWGEVVGVEGRVMETVKSAVADANVRTCFLASGDPGFFGIGKLLLGRAEPGEVAVHPAVSSVQLGFARAGLCWEDAKFVSVHGRVLESLAGVLGSPKVGILTDSRNSPDVIARFLLDCGWGELEMIVCEDLGLTTERVTRGTADDMVDWSGSNLNVVILYTGGEDQRPLGPGLAEELFVHPRGRITKSEVRAVALGLLELPREGVMWDVGAGSGSVSIEAGLLRPGLRLFALEKSDEAVEHIRENRKKFRMAGLTVVDGEAPGIFDGLDDPDCVFIGGSGGNLSEILDNCHDRLNEGGRLVISVVLVETLRTALDWCERRSLEYSMTEISATRSRKAGQGTLRSALNPITLVKVVKDE